VEADRATSPVLCSFVSFILLRRTIARVELDERLIQVARDDVVAAWGLGMKRIPEGEARGAMRALFQKPEEFRANAWKKWYTTRLSVLGGLQVVPIGPAMTDV